MDMGYTVGRDYPEYHFCSLCIGGQDHIGRLQIQTRVSTLIGKFNLYEVVVMGEHQQTAMLEHVSLHKRPTGL